MLRAAVEAYHSQTDAPLYTVTESGGGFHIVPIAAAGADGNPAAPINLLDAVVTIPYAKRTPTEHFQALCDAIAAQSGVKILCAAGPATGLLETLYLPNGRYFHLNDMVFEKRTPTGETIQLTPEQAKRKAQIHEQMSIGWGAQGVTARDAMVSLLEPSATTFTWHLLCQGGLGLEGRTCVLNVTTINIVKKVPGGDSAYPLLLWDRCTSNCPKLRVPPPPLHRN
jgi:hypothetical protein